MNSLNMKIFRFFNKLADYFWKKGLQQRKERVYHGTNTKTKKITKSTSRSNSKKSKKT